MESPISLTPEQKKAYDEKRLQDFLKEIGEVEKKHHQRLIAVLDFNQVTGIRPRMIAVPEEAPQNKE